MRIRKYHTGIFAFEDNTSGADEEIIIPEDLAALSDEELDALEERTTGAFDELYGTSPTDTESVNTLAQLADAVDALRGERTRRETERAEAQARADELNSRIHASTEAEGEGDENGEGEGDGERGESETVETPDAGTAPAPESLAAGGQPTPRQTEPAQPRRTQRINVPLSEIRRRAPQPQVEPQLTITAAADVPHFSAGHQFASITDLANAFSERAKSTPISASGNTDGPKVASIRLDFEHVVTPESTPSQIRQMIRELTNVDSLVAAGGWCAPSEVTYEFFDITCEDGMIDIPTFGVQRGGIRWPVSPGLSDVFDGTFTNETNPWLWTETDDILAATGSSPRKPCVRVPCPTFDERRLECYGICLTAGNLTDDAFPEATAHQLGLLRSAHFHAANQRYIATMVALSSAPVTGGIFAAGDSISADLPASVEWAAVDYRTRHGMCADAILEVVLPVWAKATIRADLARRAGVDMLAVTDAQINDFFDVRSVRVQYVQDWQIRGANQPGGATPTNTYPATVDFMLYAAGTFARGNGLSLDLGVVRDSVLNETNDHTAAWAEDCHLIARFGLQSRLYRVAICAAGQTGDTAITCA